jgi:RNA polymerase sigma factor (TIGR02999 family)
LTGTDDDAVSDVTEILIAVEHGSKEAAEELLPVIYQELRLLAVSKMAKESPDQTLQPTALVHEAYLRLVKSPSGQEWDHRGHFFGAAAEAMRRILVERARRKKAIRHGGDLNRTELAESLIGTDQPDDQLLLVHEALDNLAKVDQVNAEVVKHRYFVGMTNAEVAKVMNVSEATSKRHWEYARAWLFTEIKRLGKA